MGMTWKEIQEEVEMHRRDCEMIRILSTIEDELNMEEIEKEEN